MAGIIRPPIPSGEWQQEPKKKRPGKELGEDIKEWPTTYKTLAKISGVSVIAIKALVGGRKKFTADTAIRLGRALQTSPLYWLDRQAKWDVYDAFRKAEKRYRAIKPVDPDE